MTSKDIIELRRKLGLTQKEFGVRLGYAHPQPRVSELERGEQSVSRPIEIICEQLEREVQNATEQVTKEAYGRI